MKIKYWCDSGANIHSCLKGQVDLYEEEGISDEEWEEMPYEAKEEIMKDYAFAKLDWGWEIV